MYLFLVISLQAGGDRSTVQAIHHAQKPPVSPDRSQSAPSALAAVSGSQELSWRQKGPCLPRLMRDCSQTPEVPQGMALFSITATPSRRVGLQLSQHAVGLTWPCARTSQTLALFPPAVQTLAKALSPLAMVFHSLSFFCGWILSSQKRHEFCSRCCILRL